MEANKPVDNIKKYSVVGTYLNMKHIGKGKQYNQETLANKLQVTRQTINNIVTGKRQLSTGLAMRFAVALNEPLEFWMQFKKTEQNNDDLPNNIIKILDDQSIILELEQRGPHTLESSEINKVINAGLISLGDYSKELIQSVSVDLRCGDHVAIEKGEKIKSFQLNEGDIFTIEPKGIAVVTTYELLDFTDGRFFARVGSLTELTTNGIVAVHGIHVDPGFKGPFHLTLYNASNTPYIIEYLQPVISLEINYLGVIPEKLYNGNMQNQEDILPAEREMISKVENPEHSNITLQEVEEKLAFYNKLKQEMLK